MRENESDDESSHSKLRGRLFDAFGLVLPELRFACSGLHLSGASHNRRRSRYIDAFHSQDSRPLEALTMRIVAVVFTVASLTLTMNADARAADGSYRVDVPDVVLDGVPVQSVTITRLDADGDVDRAFHGRVSIHGVELRGPKGAERPPAFEDGVLELKADPTAARAVFVTDSEIVVDADGPARTVKIVRRVNRWWSLLPPVLAIVLAFLLKNVLIALFLGVFSGAVVLTGGDVLAGFAATLDRHLLGQIAGSESQVMIILFTLFLGAMIGVMSASGGTRAVVASLSRFTRTREHGQLTTWLLGFVVFFDDYANTLLVGGTMRPVADRLRFSRAKLAFLVDATAAPVAGLAVISTWVGVEIGFIQKTYEALFGPEGWSGYGIFLETIVYRFYPLLLLGFVGMIAWTGRDFGPMRLAEQHAFETLPFRIHETELNDADADSGVSGNATPRTKPPNRDSVWNAILPLLTLVVLIVAGLWWTGRAGLDAANATARTNAEAETPVGVQSILDNAKTERVLLIASFAAAAVAVLTAVVLKSLPVNAAVEAWVDGARGMFFAVLVLVLAWAVAAICDGAHLNTAGFLVDLTAGRVSAEWTPALSFILCGVMSFATGTSFGTMGLMMPLSISISYYLLAAQGPVSPEDPVLLATVGAVLAGAIFGDHCSPISDTTVLSSAASGCDHLEHVSTQLPYALVVGAVSLACCYIPIGYGLAHPLILCAVALVVLFGIVRFCGRRVEPG